jgi:hypothetical protein
MNSRTSLASGAALALVSLLAIAGCGGYGGGNYSSGSGQVASITISPASATIAVNGTQQYAAVAKDSGGNTVTGVTYTWTSSNTAVATINSNGLATGVAAGSTMITASVTYSGGVYGMGTTVTSNSATLTVSVTAMAAGTVAVGRAVAKPATSVMLNGGSGRAVQAAIVSLKDSGGQTVVAMTDASGRFQLATSGLNPGFLLKAVDNQGHVLYSFADSAGNLNITPFTDLMVRMWYRAHGSTAEAAFANPAAHPLPNVAQLTQLNKTVTGLLADALTREGLDPAKFNLVSTPFTANDTGFGAVLDKVAVLAQANGQILLRDTLGNRETAISFDAAHDTVTLSTANLSGRSASRTNVVLR